MLPVASSEFADETFGMDDVKVRAEKPTRDPRLGRRHSLDDLGVGKFVQSRIDGVDAPHSGVLHQLFARGETKKVSLILLRDDAEPFKFSKFFFGSTPSGIAEDTGAQREGVESLVSGVTHACHQA